MGDWGTKLTMYPLVPMDNLPPVSSFALRSQEDPRYCLGVRATKPKDPEDPDIPLSEGALIETQECSDGATTQYWMLNSRNLLVSALDNSYVVHSKALQKGEALSVKKYECVTPDGKGQKEQCPKWLDADKYAVNGGAKGGLIYSMGAKTGNMVLSFGKLKKSVPAQLEACGSVGSAGANVANCGALSLASLEFKPMFLTEMNKMAIGCAPYTHSLTIKPKVAKDEKIAMALCAKQADCLAYNWASQDAVCPSTPPCESKYKGHAWTCTALHEIHSAQNGWSLGVRAGKLEPFVEEEQARSADEF